LERGRVDEAAALVEPATIPEYFAQMSGWATLLDARARVRLALGDRQGGVAAFRDAGSVWEACAVRNPNVSSWRSELALALAADDAQAAQTLVENELLDARRAGSSRALGVAFRARGILAGGSAGLEDLTRAVGELERSPALLERARALTDLGAALRRSNRRSDAREPLQRARELAHRCGATALAVRAEGELHATGSRPRRLALSGSASLTPSERRVAALAASGLENREIAQQLFVTVNTVESHLRATYRKLGIKSRKQLQSTLSET
jgi:DNA-binding CsgD family transcriptional regulator